MTFSGWNKWALVSAVAMGLIAVSQDNVARQRIPTRGSATTANTLAPELKPDRSVDQQAELNCPQGIEHILPGVYYHCVGIRDVARGKYDRARSMLQIAASWGSKPAEFLLGVGYYKGDLQPRDRARGLAWLGLASERKDPTYLAIFASAWKQATPQEQARAQQLWDSMLPIYGDQRAARRAAARFRHERDALLANRQTNGQQTCIAGLTTGSIHALSPSTPLDDNSSACGGGEMPVAFVVKRLDGYAGDLLEGWNGHVTVGDLQVVPVTPR